MGSKRTGKMEQGGERVEKVILRSPALTGAAEGLIRFLLGAVLAGGEILGTGAPFGIGLVACSGSGPDGLCAMAGASLGYLFFRAPAMGLRYAAACVLVFSVAFAFYDVKVYQKVWFMPLVAAGMDAATGFVYLADVNWSLGQAALFGSEVVLTGCSAYFYRIAFSRWKSRREIPLTTRQIVSLLFLLGSLLVSLAGITFFGDLSLGRILAVLLVMGAAHAGGLGVGAAGGVAVGLGMDLCAGGVGFYTTAYGFAGLLTGAGWKQGRLFGAITYVVANAVAVLWAWEDPIRFSALYEVFIASVLFLLIPDRYLRRLGALLSRQEEGAVRRRVCEYVSRKLSLCAGAFRSVRDSLRASFPDPGLNDGDPAKIFDRAAQRVCAQCPLQGTCWQRDYVSTYSALNDALPVMLDRGKGEGGDFPGWFTARCIHFPRFLQAANEEVVALRYRRHYQSRLRESRGAVCRQYETLSDILSAAAAELSAELTPDPARERRLKQHLADLGLEGETAVYYDEAGHLRLELEGEGMEVLATPQEQKALSDLMGMPMRCGEELPGRVTLVQAEPLMAVAGIAARRREGQTESGDTGTWFKREDGSLFVLLCDGMGSGEWAHRESALAVRLLEEFLRSGMDSAAALRTVNSALALRNEESGAFTTVDLLRLDLYTGSGEVCKLGAAPTYLRKGGTVGRFTGAALPAGLAPGSPDVTRLDLVPGDCVVLTSDGVADGEADDWLRELVAAFDGESPRELAQTVMEESEKRVGPADDRTTVVIQLKRR